MEIILSYILEIEVRDKRYVGFVFINMEKDVLKNVLFRFKNLVNVVELVIDVLFFIKKFIGKLILLL